MSHIHLMQRVKVVGVFSSRSRNLLGKEGLVIGFDGNSPNGMSGLTQVRMDAHPDVANVSWLVFMNQMLTPILPPPEKQDEAYTETSIPDCKIAIAGEFA